MEFFLSRKSYKDSEDQKVSPLPGQNLHRMLCPDQRFLQSCTIQGSQYPKGCKITYTVLSFFIVLASINSILNNMFQFKCLSYMDHNELAPSGMKQLLSYIQHINTTNSDFELEFILKTACNNRKYIIITIKQKEGQGQIQSMQH